MTAIAHAQDNDAELVEQIISAWAFAHNIDGAARNDLFARLRQLARLSVTTPDTTVLVEAQIREAVKEGDGFWRSCSGCYETSEGQNVNGYPFSGVFDCILGGGCHECGGIGAVWDNTDYEGLADWMQEQRAALASTANPTGAPE